MKSKKQPILAAIIVVLITCFAGYAETIQQTDQTKTIKKTRQSVAAKKALKEAVEKGKEKAKKMTKVVNADVLQGFKDVQEAINYLDNKKPEVEKAIKSLQAATGKFEGAVSLDKDLAFAPVEISIQTNMLIASPDEVERELAFIEDLIGDGKVQDARRLLMPLQSEIVL